MRILKSINPANEKEIMSYKVDSREEIGLILSDSNGNGLEADIVDCLNIVSGENDI